MVRRYKVGDWVYCRYARGLHLILSVIMYETIMITRNGMTGYTVHISEVTREDDAIAMAVEDGWIERYTQIIRALQP